MAEVTIGVFSSNVDAEYAIHDLRDIGYRPKDISLIMRDTQNAQQRRGTVAGLTTGSLIGGLTGLMVGVGIIAAPGIGALLIGGPLAAALGISGMTATTVSGATADTLKGGLLGILLHMGISEDDARLYEDKIGRGGIVVIVPNIKGSSAEVAAILEENDAEQIKTITPNQENRIRAFST
jgi:hypothetical protein